MKKSEKLLDAIGQIDDRLVEEAAKAGAPAETKKRRKKKRVTMYRLQGALAACAMLMVCAGIASLVQRNGISSKSSGSAEIMQEAAMDSGGYEEAAPADEEAVAPADSGEGAAVVTAGNEVGGRSAAEAEGQDGGAASELTELSKSSEDRMGTALQEEEEKEGAQGRQTALQSGHGAEEAERDNADGQQEEIQNGVGGRIVESSTLALTFVVENDGERDIVLEEAYGLELFAEGEWQTVYPVAEVCWKEPEIVVEVGGAYETTTSLKGIYSELKPGQYRLVKHYLLAAGKEPQGMERYPLYLEFTVEP